MHGLTEDDYRRRVVELEAERDRAWDRVVREQARTERAAGAERSRIRRKLEEEMDGPGLDWSDVDQVQALIDRVCPEGDTQPSCTWTEDGDGVFWRSGCGNAFQFEVDGPADNGMRFCPYCGKGLETAVQAGEPGDVSDLQELEDFEGEGLP